MKLKDLEHKGGGAFRANLIYRNTSKKVRFRLYDGASFLALEFKRWNEDYTTYIDYAFIEEVDINTSSSDWNFIKVSYGRYKEGGLSFDADQYQEYIDNQEFCKNDNECVATCGYGCVNKYWFQTIGIDCEAVVTFSCKCVNNTCR